jgi:hypothetical protein
VPRYCLQFLLWITPNFPSVHNWLNAWLCTITSCCVSYIMFRSTISWMIAGPNNCVTWNILFRTSHRRSRKEDQIPIIAIVSFTSGAWHRYAVWGPEYLVVLLLACLYPFCYLVTLLMPYHNKDKMNHRGRNTPRNVYNIFFLLHSGSCQKWFWNTISHIDFYIP